MPTYIVKSDRCVVTAAGLLRPGAEVPVDHPDLDYLLRRGVLDVVEDDAFEPVEEEPEEGEPFPVEDQVEIELDDAAADPDDESTEELTLDDEVQD